jgi:hypothetical protein
MTVSSTVRTAGPYLGTGSVSNYPFAFKVFATTDLLVQVTTAGVLVDLVYGSDYSVSINSDQNADPGGWVTLTSPLALSAALMIGSVVPQTQPTRITNPGGFFPQVQEDTFDRCVILIQQAAGNIGGSIRVPEIGGVPALPAAAQRAGLLLGFDEAGNAIAVAPVNGSATALALLLAGTTGAANIGIADAANIFTATTVEAAIARLGKDARGRLRDVRDFPGIVADGATDDFLAFQTAAQTARDGGYGIFFPKGVKLFIQFSTTHPQLCIDGPVHWEGADRMTCGFNFHCNYEMPAGHAPLFMWGVQSKSAVVNKVTGIVRGIGWWLQSGAQRFESCCHVYGAKDFTVEECYADFTAVTWPAKDGGHSNGYQAGGWWRSNVQPSWATGQTRDENIRFIRNIGYASAEYQNAESIGFTNVYGLEYVGNKLIGFSDDLAAHQCTWVTMRSNHVEGVSSRLFLGNCHHAKIIENEILPVPRPIVGGYDLGAPHTRTYIISTMYSQDGEIYTDTPSYDITIARNSIYLPSGSYCSTAITTYGVQDGLSILDNKLYNDGATSPATSILVSTLYRNDGVGKVWTGPVGNPDYAAGGAVRMRSVVIRGNQELGAGWAPNEGQVTVGVYAGGSSSDIIGPIEVDANVAGSYYLSHEPVHFSENNRALPASTAPYQNVSAVCLLRNHRQGYIVELKTSQQLEGTHHPVGSPQTVLDAYGGGSGMVFAAQQDGSVRGVMLTLTAAMVAGNACTVSILKNGSLLGSVATTSLAAANTFRYLANFAGTAMAFAKGDSIAIQLGFDVSQVTAIAGKAELMVIYE